MRITQSFKASKMALVLAAASLAVACGFFATAQPAAAECPTGDLDCTPGPIITHRTISNTLTVTKTQGTVTSDPAGINCGADCTATSSQTVACSDGDCAAPDPDGWDSYSLTATGGVVVVRLEGERRLATVHGPGEELQFGHGRQ